MNKHSSFLSEHSEDELLLLLKAGEEGFMCIYKRYHQMLYILAYRYLKDENAAKDAVQSIFLKLWETRTFLNIHISLKNYLYTMLKNYLLNEIRNNSTALEKQYELAQQTVTYENEILEKLENEEQTQSLYQAIERLPEQKRVVCLYKLKEGLSNQEIAERMQISVPTVKSHYTQAIKLLRECLSKILLFSLFF